MLPLTLYRISAFSASEEKNLHPVALTPMPGVLSVLSTCAVVPVRYNRSFDNRLKNINFDHYEIAWRDLVPDTDSYQEIFAQPI